MKHFIRVLAIAALALPSLAAAQEKEIVIRASRVLDGKGNVLHDTRIVVQGSKIVRLDPSARPVTYDLRGTMVLPGWIDTHVHITYHFGPNGRAEDRDETPQQATLAGASNAYVTLMSGFTTVQSLGSPADKDLRDMIARGRGEATRWAGARAATFPRSSRLQATASVRFPSARASPTG